MFGASKREPTPITTLESASNHATDIDVSDLESDLEPEDLISVYLSTKARIFNLEPGANATGQVGGRKKKPSTSQHTKSSLAVTKLEQKLKKIEKDVLFDQHEADDQWNLRRNQLAQENAQRRKLQLPPLAKVSAKTSVVNSGQASSTESDPSSRASSSDDSDDDDDDAAFGDLFASTAQDDEPQVPKAEGQTGPENNIIIRDFGQFKGISPRRVLEEACRARYVPTIENAESHSRF